MSRSESAGDLKDEDRFPFRARLYFFFEHAPVKEINRCFKNVGEPQLQSREIEQGEALFAVEIRDQVDI